jgi:hypothetical protein
VKRCPVCGETDCPWWESRYEEHDDSDAEDAEELEEDELEYERRQRG